MKHGKESPMQNQCLASWPSTSCKDTGNDKDCEDTALHSLVVANLPAHWLPSPRGSFQALGGLLLLVIISSLQVSCFWFYFFAAGHKLSLHSMISHSDIRI